MFHRHMGNLLLALVLVLCTGILAAATPCVYPIIPLTSALLMARGGASPRQGRLHALVYFCGMMLFYTLLGAVAALTGTALSALMTNAWINIGFAVLFAYLGLSMLGLFEFQLLPALTAKLDGASARWGGFTGTFVMGGTAGLIVSPCIGPIVGAILLQITGQSAVASAVEPHTSLAFMFRGIVLMTGFGAGLGLPFLVVGLLSHRLPQSGQWLSYVKFLLGLPILYFAYTYYLKGMETHGVPVNVAHAILLGIVAIMIAVFLGAFHGFNETPHRGVLLRRACSIILLIIGIHFLYNGLGRSGILLTPSQRVRKDTSAQGATGQTTTSTPNSPPQETYGNLHWWRDFLHAQQQAKTEHKPLFVDFYATWCANCKAFQNLTVRNEHLNAALQRAVLVKIYDTDTIFQTFQENEQFPELRGVGGQPFLPLFAIYSPQGDLVWKGQNYQAVQTMMVQLEYAAQTAQP
jgi:thiol:disulfide interchange protein DsbD